MDSSSPAIEMLDSMWEYEADMYEEYIEEESDKSEECIAKDFNGMFDDNNLGQQSPAECGAEYIKCEEYILGDYFESEVCIGQQSPAECGEYIAPLTMYEENGCTLEVNGSSTKPKKRQKNTKLWKNNIRKVLRESGNSYITVNKKEQPAREMKAPCNDCKLNCLNLFTPDDRMNIFQSFWNMTDDEKNSFYFKFVTRHPIKRRRTNSTTKKSSFLYYFEKDQFVYRVCRTFFLNTLSISQKRIYYCFEYLNDANTGTPIPRKKGKHAKRVTPPNKLAEVRDHISSFPTIDSHYCRANSQKKYIDGSLNVNRMYNLYLQKTEKPVGKHIYRAVFNNEFNISFFKPKKDQCDKCVAFYNKENILTQNEIHFYEEHKAEKNALKEERDKDRQNTNPSICTICYDLQSVFSLPKGNASTFYYKRKLSMYNLTATVIMPNVKPFTYCALWTEAHSGRSGNDIASALVKILNELVKEYPGIKTVILWSDSCVPQNKNQINTTAIKVFLKKNDINVIIQKFSEPGHSLIQEVDCVHGVIDRYLKHLDINSPPHLLTLLRNMPTNKTQLKVLEMLPNDFRSYSLMANKFDFRKVPFSKIKVIIYNKSDEFQVHFKNSGRDLELQTVSIIKSASKNVFQTPENVLLQKLKILTPKTITKDKKRDIKDLITFLPKADQIYFTNLLNIF